MKILKLKRAQGKTRAAIEESSRTNRNIIVNSHIQVDLIKQQAKELGLTIPSPISVQQWQRKQYAEYGNKKDVIVDEAQFVLQQLLGVGIHMMTLNDYDEGEEEFLYYDGTIEVVNENNNDDDDESLREVNNIIINATKNLSKHNHNPVMKELVSDLLDALQILNNLDM